MPSVCFYFQAHQPLRVKQYRVFDIGNDHSYFSDKGDGNLNNQRVLRKIADKCYLPANALLLELLERHPKFRVSFSFSGVLLDELERFLPDTLASFQKLVRTNRVEILSETYHHSLAFLYSQEEFRRQVELHRRRIEELFHVTPSVFRNTELIYSNALAETVQGMGYRGILGEGADHILGWRSPNFLYRPKGCKGLALLLKNYRLSDDIAFRFSANWWNEHPLTAQKFASWISALNGNGETVNLFMDYETFGEHQWADTGIFEFLRALPAEILKHPDNDFATPGEIITRYRPVAELDMPDFVSWADIERDLSAWRSNAMQHEALEKLYALEGSVLGTHNPALIEDWRRLQTSDHFYYMCTKWFADGDVHKYFNPYESPYDAFIAFMNVLHDVEWRVKGEVT